MQGSESLIEIRRVGPESFIEAFAIVTQYYAAFGVLEREDRSAFEAHYFGRGCGFWLASSADEVVGCIGLRSLPQLRDCGEVKRLYVAAEYRRRRIAGRLLNALESAAAEYGYKWLYLDSNEHFGDALRFYKKHGYEDCGRYNANPQATLFMRKQLTL